MKLKNTLLIIAFLFASASCKDYLDIVPDNVATLENAFTMRTTAERFLFTCYSYMPAHGNYDANPALGSGDEFWLPPALASNAKQIALGNQRIVNPYMNFWEGANGGKNLFLGIRDCNIFLENVDRVPDIEEFEKTRWKAEVKFLKAYYHYWLMRLYGAIPLIKENLPVSASVEEVQIPREPFDACVTYVVEQLDEAAADLPDRIENEVAELGRVSKAIALSVKAEVLITAASPLFNGNPDYAGVKGTDGTALFNTAQDPAKWEKAAKASKEAIDFCESLGYRLYYYRPQFSQYKLSDTTITQMNVRNSVCEPWNEEIIWGNVISRSASIQTRSTPRGLDPARITNRTTTGDMGVTMKIAEMFYSENGIPINEDPKWDYVGRYGVKTGDVAHRYVLKANYITSSLNFNREPRFYANLGFDGGIWYGQGQFDDKSPTQLFLSAKKGNPASMIHNTQYSVSGYWPKKLVHFQSVIGAGDSYTVQQYPWPVFRLANLYLMYAEALNEVGGPGADVYRYIDMIRERAGLLSVDVSWTNFSRNPAKHRNKEGLREIIHQERNIELALEGQRFWDLRRWKEAVGEMNKPVMGWDTFQSDAVLYYKPTLVYNQRFTTRDYLWPINENEMLKNKNLVQNPGW